MLEASNFKIIYKLLLLQNMQIRKTLSSTKIQYIVNHGLTFKLYFKAIIKMNFGNHWGEDKNYVDEDT